MKVKKTDDGPIELSTHRTNVYSVASLLDHVNKGGKDTRLQDDHAYRGMRHLDQHGSANASSGGNSKNKTNKQ